MNSMSQMQKVLLISRGIIAARNNSCSKIEKHHFGKIFTNNVKIYVLNPFLLYISACAAPNSLSLKQKVSKATPKNVTEFQESKKVIYIKELNKLF